MRSMSLLQDADGRLADSLASLGLPQRFLVLIERGEERSRAGEEPLLERLEHEVGRHLLGVVLGPLRPAVRRTASARRGSPVSSSVYGTSSGSSTRFGNRGEPSHFGGSSDFMRRTMTALSCLRSGWRAAGEPLVVEQFEQRREALGVAVVRRGRQEQLVLEVRGQQPEGLGPQRVGGVLAPTGRGAVVGLVHDQQVELAGKDRLVRPRQESPGTAAAVAPA